MDFDLDKARLSQPDMFKRFRVPDKGTPLRSWSGSGREGIITFERGGQWRALPVRPMAYHHLAQGELAGEPYLVSF